MKKVICKVTYDTDAAQRVAQYTSGEWGDPAGFEETLYQTVDGKLFLYVNGGEESPYKAENITRMSAAKSDEWRRNRGV